LVDRMQQSADKVKPSIDAPYHLPIAISPARIIGTT